jgi:L-2,4-diaminobutyrate transaminase
MSAQTDLSQLDRQHFLHPFTSIQDQAANGPLIMTDASGCHIRDAQGREYLDAMAGLWCVNIGYSRKEVADAIAAQAMKLPYYHSFIGMSNEPVIRLAAKLAELAPGSLNHTFFANSGSEANDTQVKLVRYYNNVLGRPNKKKFIARQNAYHGVTVASVALTGLPPLHQAFDTPEPWVIRAEKPHAYWNMPEGMTELEWSAKLADDLDATILKEGPDTVAAFIAEPIMGAGGVIVPPEGYFDAIVPVLRKHDVLLIADEVVCGFGRLGKWFGSQYYGFEPDLMSVAKGLTSGYVPMSACLVSDKIFAVLQAGSKQYGQFAHGFTYSAHPLAAAAANANLALIEQEGLLANAETVGAHLQKRLRETLADHPLVGEVRGKVMIAGIELVADKATKKPFPLEVGPTRRLYKLLMEDGLLCRPIANMLAMSPPLILTETQADEIVDKIALGLDKLASAFRAEGVWQG